MPSRARHPNRNRVAASNLPPPPPPPDELELELELDELLLDELEELDPGVVPEVTGSAHGVMPPD